MCWLQPVEIALKGDFCKAWFIHVLRCSRAPTCWCTISRNYNARPYFRRCSEGCIVAILGNTAVHCAVRYKQSTTQASHCDHTAMDVPYFARNALYCIWNEYFALMSSLQYGTYDDDAAAGGMRTMLHLTARALRIKYTIKGQGTVTHNAAEGCGRRRCP